MGLTAASTGLKSIDMGFTVKKIKDDDRVIALAGNPNVGKSTVFNKLTGLKQHTGNWPGKTVSNAMGITEHNGKNYVMVDIPGTYSLMANSQEEEVARDFICFGNPDAVVVVCDATCLERNFNLVLQTAEITDNVVVCVNLMDEARKKEIKVDLKAISEKLGLPVVGTSARSGRGLREMMDGIETVLNKKTNKKLYELSYEASVEAAIDKIVPVIRKKIPDLKIKARWVALKLIDVDEKLIENLGKFTGLDIANDVDIQKAVAEANEILQNDGISSGKLKDKITSAIVMHAESICRDTVVFENSEYNSRDRKIDRILTNKLTGLPIMIALLCLVFWITITGANIPSAILSDGLFWLEDRIVELCISAGVPEIVYSIMIFGVYRVLAWVISVMLPPMAIFFPLFTLLEDLGYLPRVAFNLDKTFKKCCACGKQALTMR